VATLTIEDRLAAARTNADRASYFMAELKKVYDAANAEMPRPWCATKKQRTKADAWGGIYDRLLAALRAPREIEYEMERMEVAKRQAEDAKAKAARDAEEKRKASAEVDDAITWLQSRGKVIGTDFSNANAIAVANDIAADEEIERVRPGDGEWTEFAGDDNCEDCRGWDGKERRCDCGRRRVSWSTGDGHSFKHPFVYAEAF